MALPSYLNVPLVYQENDYSCVPACIKMVIDFARNQSTASHIPDMTVDEISTAISTDELGTSLENVEKINEKLLKALPSVEFVAEMNCSFAEIEEELLKGNPVIAWVKIPYSHSVVITGVDTTLLIVYYNDPQKGKKQMEMGKFVSSWGEADNILIKVKIGEKLQKIIPEYVEEKELKGEQE